MLFEYLVPSLFFYTLPFVVMNIWSRKMWSKNIQTSGLTETTGAFRVDIIVQRLPTYTYKHTLWGSINLIPKLTTFNTQNQGIYQPLGPLGLGGIWTTKSWDLTTVKYREEISTWKESFKIFLLNWLIPE